MTLVDEAVDAFVAAVESLLPADDTHAPRVLATPTRVSPTGLGGFVGLNSDPPGDIVGCRLRVTLLVTISADDATALDATADGATRALLGADRKTLLEQGILRIALAELGAARAGEPFERDLRFDVVYEFVKRPTEIEGGVIREIPIGLGVAES